MRLRSGSKLRERLKASAAGAVSHVSNSSSVDSNTGMRSWLMLSVNRFGTVVMKLYVSTSTGGPSFLIGACQRCQRRRAS
jgi:hypothetical protein